MIKCMSLAIRCSGGNGICDKFISGRNADMFVFVSDANRICRLQIALHLARERVAVVSFICNQFPVLETTN